MNDPGVSGPARGTLAGPSARRIEFDGKDFADGRTVIAEVHEVILRPGAEFDFPAGDGNELPHAGRMKTLPRREPFVVDFRD